MIYTREQLILNGEYFFKNEKVKKMLGTVDGQYFYPEHKSFLDAHVKANKIEWVTFNMNDIEKIKKARIEELKAKAKLEAEKKAKEAAEVEAKAKLEAEKKAKEANNKKDNSQKTKK